jgi:hypothetical protein
MSLNKISDANQPAKYLNPNVGSLTLSGSNVSGYSPTNLNYYEEITGNLTFNDASGVSISGFSIAFQAQRIGNFCQFSISNSSVFTPTNVAAFIDCNNFTSVVPARFRTGLNQTIMCYTLANTTKRVGSLEFNVNGIRINAEYNQSGTFVNAPPGNLFGGATVSYRV